MGALLSSLLALDLLFRDDSQDGTLEQLALCGQPFAGLLLAKTVVHWCLTGLPLVLVAPTGGHHPRRADARDARNSRHGAARNRCLESHRGGRRGTDPYPAARGSLLALLVLPLAVPVLIFGARASALAIAGESPAAPLYLLAAFAVLAATLAPWALAAAVRIGLE